MAMCERCNKVFPFPWKLRRHYNRQTPCIVVKNEKSESQFDQNESSFDQNESSFDQNESLFDQNESSFDQNESLLNECQYCNKMLSTKGHKKRHETTCKMQHDEIWKLEKECNVAHKRPSNDLSCAFCLKTYSCKRNLHRHLESCEEKCAYKEKLEKRLNKVWPKVLIHNNTTNNIQNANTINNNTINIQVFGQESMEHVTNDKIKTILSKILESKYPGDNNLYKLSAETVADVHKLIRENELNRNIVIPHERRQIALIKRNPGDGFQKEDIANVLDDGFRNTSKKLCDFMKNLNVEKKSERIHKCVESFSKKGFRGHPEMPKNAGKYRHRREDLNNARRKFKLANV